MKWTLFRRKPNFMAGYLYVCQCNWGWYYTGHGKWIGPYWQQDDISRKYHHRFMIFNNVVSNNHVHVTWEWDTSVARNRTLGEIEENYNDCYGWLVRQRNGGYEAP